MKQNRLILLIAVSFIILGIVIGYLIGLNTPGMSDRAFLLAGLAFGVVLGFLFDWIVEELARRNNDLARQLDDLRLGQASLETTQVERVQIERVQQLQPPPPAALSAGSGADSEIAARTLAEFLHERDDELKSLRDQLDEAQEKIQTVRTESSVQVQTHREEAQLQLQAARDEAAQQVQILREEFDAYVQTHPDNLTTLKGVGPVFQRKLRDMGINSFKQLANADPEKLRRMLDIKPWQKVDIEYWIAQSKDWMSSS